MGILGVIVTTQRLVFRLRTTPGNNVRSGGRAIERRTVNRGDGGSIPPTAVSKLRQFRSHHICLCLSEETLKSSGPFYLVSVPGEVKDPIREPVVHSLILEKDNSCVSPSLGHLGTKDVLKIFQVALVSVHMVISQDTWIPFCKFQLHHS